MAVLPIDIDNPFWHFSLRVYAMPGVAEECLTLQEATGCDINVLLFCVWRGAVHGVRLDEKDVALIIRTAQPWSEAVVKPLRAIRMHMRNLSQMSYTDVAALRKAFAAIEVESERIEQALLHSGVVPLPPSVGAADRWTIAAENAELYLRHTEHTEARSSIAKLLDAAVGLL